MIIYNARMLAAQLTPNAQSYGRVESFRRLRKIAKKRLSASSCLPVRMQLLGLHWTDFYKIWYLSIFFENLSKKFKFHDNVTRKTGTLLKNTKININF
jgi:hypothetical protein